MTLYGLDRQISDLRAAMAGERMHHAWLLAGARGIGKASFAAYAARLLLDAEVPGSQGARLVEAGSHPDFLWLERLQNEKTGALARNITVDQVRLLRTLFATGTAISMRRVIVVDSIDDMERGAANALLKSLEEPPACTIFLLISHQPGRLLPTIRSRCRPLMFRPLDDATMTSFVDGQLPNLTPAQRDELIASAKGVPAAAVAHAELDLTTLDAALTELAQTGDPTNAVRSRLAHALSLKAAAPRYEAFLHRAPGYIADCARRASGAELEQSLNAWSRARALSQIAIAQSLVAETVVFEMAGHVASLARREK